jgi:hypothetical protein
MRAFRRGTLIETYQDRNLIVNGARAALAALIAGEGSGKTVSGIAFGTNAAVPAPDDTGITGAFTKTLDGFVFPAPGRAEFRWSLASAEANGLAISEFGLLCADGTLFARKNRAAPIYKDSDITLEGQWLITF